MNEILMKCNVHSRPNYIQFIIIIRLTYPATFTELKSLEWNGIQKKKSSEKNPTKKKCILLKKIDIKIRY